MLRNKANRNFWAACWIEKKIVCILLFIKAFYAGFDQVDSIFSLEVTLLPNNHKNYLEIQRPLTLFVLMIKSTKIIQS